MNNRPTFSRRLCLLLTVVFAVCCGFLHGADGEVKNEEVTLEQGRLLLQTDPEGAFKVFLRAAENGDADAMAAVGFCYGEGSGVERDDEKARVWFQKSHQAGSEAGTLNLVTFLIKGRGGDADVREAINILEDAITAGNRQARLVLGELYYSGMHANGQPDFQKAYNVYLAAAEDGDPVAQNVIGVLFKDNLLPVTDQDAARVWLEKSAHQGNGKACFNLALLWDPMSPNRNDRIEAVRWLIVGRELNEITAEYMYLDIENGLDREELNLAKELAATTLESIRRRVASE